MATVRRSKAISAPENFTYVEPVVNTYTNSEGKEKTIVAAGGTKDGKKVVVDARFYYPIKQGTTNTPDTSKEPYLQFIEWYDAEVQDEKK